MEIAIAGAGIAGLTAAMALASRGFSATIYERADKLTDIGAGIHLAPNAMTMFQRLGLADVLAADTVEPRALVIREGPNGRVLTSVPLRDESCRRYGAPYCVIHRADLQRVLSDAANADPDITLKLGAEITEVRQDGSRVTFALGGRRCYADLLIAADGIHSAIRIGALALPGPGQPIRHAWRKAIAADDLPTGIERDATGLWLASGYHLVHYPVRAGRQINLVLVAATDRASPGELLGKLAAPASGLADVKINWIGWPLSAIDPAGRWARGRIALIGDAAHAMLPTVAQGGAQAIEDAWVLADCLAATPDQPATALQRYERRRKTRVVRVFNEAQRNATIYGLGGLAAVARNAAIALLPGPTHLARLDWLYRFPEG
ncbi:MAG TPA: FAD-dependent monooxygenase [Afifellaceae bacterium]|nr:FAD-dependent monooxygenase [Afifellaceae bacterium]